ncbi:MAG: GntR family transcriptional regulator [Bacilli bacterium]|nr:GntR family transcriptional regulator [Bacilli bacterium]
MQFNGQEPIFLQIASYYRRLILIGALRKDEMLPSVREVALEARVNPNTVQRAFSLLAEEGYIVSLPKKGNLVSYENGKSQSAAEIEKALSELLAKGYRKDDIRRILNEMEEVGK